MPDEIPCLKCPVFAICNSKAIVDCNLLMDYILHRESFRTKHEVLERYRKAKETLSKLNVVTAGNNVGRRAVNVNNVIRRMEQDTYLEVK